MPEVVAKTNPNRATGLAVLVAVALGYLGFAAAATYPVILTARTQLPGHLSDPLEHLWIMRWTESCLADGRAPFFCPDLHYPSGVPLGLFPTMHLQTAGYLALGLLTSDDVVRFNALWFFGFASTGMASFILAWWTIRRFWPAWLAGLGAMLCGPMLMHAHGHLETMQMGAVPLFLVGWLRFVDRPGVKRLAVAAVLYLLVVASAPYFAVLAVFPAGWYVAWSALMADKGGRGAWIRGRLAWLAGFVAATLPALAFLFSSQIWAAVHGYAMERPRSQFNWFGAPAWSYLAPTPWHAVGKILPIDPYAATGYGRRVFECESYLGLMALGVLGYAAVRRVRFPRAGFWWSALAMMIVLSLSSTGPFGWPMPAGWLYDLFSPFHLIRVPARFNLFAAVCASVPVAAGFRDLLDGVGGRGWKGATIAACSLATLADLAIVPFPTATIPEMPAIYRDLARRDPGVSLVDAPMFGSSQGHILGSLCGYWQSSHHARTSAGYSGVPNLPFDAEVLEGSPWSASKLGGPADMALSGFGPIRDVAPRDYAWVFLTAHHYDDLVLHQGPMLPMKFAAGVARWKAELADARIAEDAFMAVYDRSKLPPPTSPVATIGAGWRRTQEKPPISPTFAALRSAQVILYNPSPDRSLSLTMLGVSSPGRSRTVRLLDRDRRERAAWTIGPGRGQTLVAPSLSLGAGLQTLTLASDDEDRPTRFAEAFDEARTPYSFRLSNLNIRPVDAPRIADQARPEAGRRE